MRAAARPLTRASFPHPVDPSTFPAALLQDLFGREYFVPDHASLLSQPPLDKERHAIAG